ncbi:MAG TPA: alpha/beta hydrolase, partial [Ktedonobacteraceae bacterium]|nr:alpha/beta hydrolase [Ktedonobacteraceae bacterium]
MALDAELYRRTVYIPLKRKGQVPRRISVIDIQPEGASHTLVFLHGYGGDALQWIYQLRFLGQRFRVIAPDMRGHGLSEDRPAHDLPYTMAGLVDDLEAVLAALQVQQPFTLIAHSFGGAIACEFALRHPEDLNGLVLIGVPSRFLLRPYMRRLIMYIPDPVFSFTAKKLRIALSAPQYTLKHLLSQVMEAWHGSESMSKLRVPTLVILGHRDNVFHREYYEDAARVIPNAQHVTISVSAHLVQLERPDAVNRAIRRFLETTDVLARAGVDGH